MRKLRETDLDLRWEQLPSWKRCFELRSGEDVIATLEWTKQSIGEATGTTAAGQWTFRHKRLIVNRVEVSATASGTEVAIFHPVWIRGGKLNMASGKVYPCRSKHELHLKGSSWSFAVVAPEGELVHLSYERSGLTWNGFATVTPRGLREPDMPLLLTLGMFVIVMGEHEYESS